MFGNNNGKDAKKTDSSSRSSAPTGGGGVNTIDAKTTIEGDLKAGGDIRIDGTLVGNLNCQAKLIIGPKGRIEGDVECVNAVVEGSFKGNLLVKDMLNLRETAKVSGDIRAKKMAVMAGCEINGTCTVTGNATPSAAPSSHKSGGNPLKQKENVAAKA